LLFLLTLTSQAAPFTRSLTYDEHPWPRTAYDVVPPCARDYDSASCLFANGEQTRSAGTRAFFAKFCEFLAAEGGSLLPVRYNPAFALEQGANPATVVPDIYTVVRGGQGALPAPGTVFSGSMGGTLQEAAVGVPHGTIRATTAGAIRGQGGSVTLAPELTRGGTLNPIHVNVMEGAQPTVFGAQILNPVPRAGRIQ
jgi:hypothetical protein